MGNGQIQSFVPANKMIAPFAINKIRGNEYAYGFGNCTFWLDAAYGINTNTDLAAVTYWKDKIKGISFDQATVANQPRLVVSDVNFNNFPSIQLQSNARYLESSFDISLSNDFALVFVGKADSDNGVNSTLSIIAGVIGTGQNALELTPVKAGNVSAQITGTSNNTNPHIIVVTKDQIVVDGVQEGTGTLRAFGGMKRIGNSGTGNNNVGRIASVLVYDGFVSSNAIDLCNNLNSKYAIY